LPRIRLGGVEVQRDIPRIRDHLGPIHQHRHLVVPREGQTVGFGKAPGHVLEIEALMGQRHARAPAIGAEDPGRIGAAEFVELPCHVPYPPVPRSLRPCVPPPTILPGWPPQGHPAKAGRRVHGFFVNGLEYALALARLMLHSTTAVKRVRRGGEER
jgi:hypothetical protein